MKGKKLFFFFVIKVKKCWIMFCNQHRSSPCIVVKGNKVNMDFTFLWATSSLTLLTIKLVF